MADTTQLDNREQQELQGLDLSLFLRDCLRGVQKSYPILLALLVLFAMLGGVRSALSYRPMYRCEASFTVNAQQSENENYGYSFYYDQSTASQMASTFPYILKSDLLTNLLREDLGVSYINGTITAKSVANSNLFTLTVTSGDAQSALNVMEAVIRNYPKVAQFVIGETKLNMIDAPRLPKTPYNQLEWVGGSIKLAGLAFVVYCGCIALYAALRSTIRKSDEIEKKLHCETAATIPLVSFKQRNGKMDKTLSIKNNKTSQSFQESFRGLALDIMQAGADEKMRVIGVTAGAVGEGTTVTARNIAAALGESGKKVVLLNCDFLRTPKNNRVTNGIEQWLAGQCRLQEVLHYDAKCDIWVAGGKRNLTHKELSALNQNLQMVFEGLQKVADYIVLDLPPMSRMDSAGGCQEYCDGVLFVIRQDNLKLSRIQEALEDLSGFECKQLGCVLNMVQGGVMGYGGYYSGYGKYHYYGYGSKKGYGRSGK